MTKLAETPSVGFDFSNFARNQFLGQRLQGIPKGNTFYLLSSFTLTSRPQRLLLVQPSSVSFTAEVARERSQASVLVLIHEPPVDLSSQTKIVKRWAEFMVCTRWQPVLMQGI